jgi:hypothetical protein
MNITKKWKLHHKVNKPLHLLAIVVAIEVLMHGAPKAGLLVLIVLAVWIAPTLRIKRKRTRKPAANVRNINRKVGP